MAMHACRRYRTRDEISSIRTQRDPVEHVRKLLLDHELADTAELKKMEKVGAEPASDKLTRCMPVHCSVSGGHEHSSAWRCSPQHSTAAS